MKKILFILSLISCTKISQIQGKVSMYTRASSLSADKPNVILILADDVGYENLTCNGGESYSTPNLDRMASQGTRFTGCHSTPLCSPSRVEIMTGQYNFRNYTQWGRLLDTNRTFGNILKDAGYVTKVFGKWQLDGGIKSARKLGFNNGILFNPTMAKDDTDELGGGSRYKDPSLFTDGHWISGLENKYGEDVLTDSLVAFISRNKSRSFLAYYPMVLCHPPFQATPDDSDFTTSVSYSGSNTKYYPSMVKYMDKCIGRIISAVDSLGLGENTIIIFTGDNGTSHHISTLFNGSEIIGGKGSVYETGTHVPLIARWLNHIPAARVDSSLIDFTDFCPTLADISNYPAGNTDGISFYPQLLGSTEKHRDWIFCSFQKNPKTNTSITRWIQNDNRKLYDSTYKYYNFLSDIYEHDTIPEDSMYLYFQNILNNLHK